MMKVFLSVLPAAVLLISCAAPAVAPTSLPKTVLATAPVSSPPPPLVQTSVVDYDKALGEMMTNGFESRGIATIERLKQDTANIECSKDVEPDAKLTEAIEKANLATIKPPSDGKYLGDFKAGETVAQSGRGNTWTDAATAPNGGNCYNCHQISKTELSYGSLGPSLYNYGKLRGNSQAIVDYTWGKLNNAKAYNACSGMPRFGHSGILTEKQIKDVMALLLDPASPVNQ